MEQPRRLPRTNRFKNKFASKKTEGASKGVTELRFNPDSKRVSRARTSVPKDAKLTCKMRKFLQKLKREARTRENQRAYLKRMDRDEVSITRTHNGALTRFENVLAKDQSQAHYLRSIGIKVDSLGATYRRDWGKSRNSKSRNGGKRVRKMPQKFKPKGGRRRGLDIDLNFK